MESPRELPRGGLRVVALGGIKEIGRNMTMFEHRPPSGKSRLLVVDCGMLLGKTNSPGVDVTLPDWSYFDERLADIDAVVLTHGHEDHIGALPYLLRARRDIPIYGSRLTLALVAAKLEQHRIHKPDLRQVREGELTDVGPWGLEFFAVNHSIPDALAVAIRVGGQTVLHTGDFKMDQTPLDGRITDLNGFARLGDEGVDLLLADSTNAEVGGFIPSERDVGRVVADVIAKAPGRIIVACFASHVHRVQQVMDAARESGRQVALVGRSMVRNMGIARELGLLHVPDGLLIDLKLAEELPSRRVLLISTGSQGEPLSALSRMANRDHQTVRIGSDDTILLASSLIPGNETSVGQVINGLSRLGATVVHKSTALVHVSGHAPAGELRYLLNAVRPANHMPVHGEWRHLRAHAAIARSTGIPDERIMLAEDGTVVDLVDGAGQDQRAHPGRLRLRRRPGGRRRGRRDAQGPPHPRRGGLPVDPRRGRPRGRQGGLRPRHHLTRVQRRPGRAGADQRRTRRGGRTRARRRHPRRRLAAAPGAPHRRALGRSRVPPPADAIPTVVEV